MGLAAFCGFALSATSTAWSSPSTNRHSVPLGVVLDEANTTTGQQISSSGTTIYDGDRLEAEGTHTLRVRLVNAQIYIQPGAVTEVRGTADEHSFVI